MMQGTDPSHEVGLFVCSLLQTLLHQSAPEPPPLVQPPPPPAPLAAAAHRRAVASPKTVMCRTPGCTKEMPFVPIKDSRLLNNSYRLKLCVEHLLADTVRYDGRDMRFCRKCHRLEDVSAFEGSLKTCVVQIVKHNQSRRDKRAERYRNIAAAAESDWAADDA